MGALLMVAHLVLFKPREDVSLSEWAALASAFRHAVGAIPTVRTVRIARRIVHGAGYEAAAPDAAFLVVIEFDDLDGLRAYLRHPAHNELGSRFGEVVGGARLQGRGTALVYDVEWLEEDTAFRL